VLTPNNELYALKRVSLDKASDEEIVGYRNEITLLRRLEGNKRIIRLIDAEMKGVPPGMGLGNGADGEKGGGERGSAERGKGSLMMVMECGEIDLAHLLQEQQMHGADLVWIRCYWKQVNVSPCVVRIRPFIWVLTSLYRCWKQSKSYTRRRSSTLI
jgi:serine/threonine-protein kinase TTK/MPS1